MTSSSGAQWLIHRSHASALEKTTGHVHAVLLELVEFHVCGGHHRGIWNRVSCIAHPAVVKNTGVVVVDLDTLQGSLVAGHFGCIGITVVECILLTLEESLLECRSVDHGWALISNSLMFIRSHVAVSLPDFIVH